MSVALEIDLTQIKKLIAQCDADEKLELVRTLEQETFGVRLSRLLEKLRADDLSLQEITVEVEAVRARQDA